MGVSKNSGTSKSSIFIGFSTIFTIHFGGFPLFLETTICLVGYVSIDLHLHFESWLDQS